MQKFKKNGIIIDLPVSIEVCKIFFKIIKLEDFILIYGFISI